MPWLFQHGVIVFAPRGFLEARAGLSLFFVTYSGIPFYGQQNLILGWMILMRSFGGCWPLNYLQQIQKNLITECVNDYPVSNQYYQHFRHHSFSNLEVSRIRFFMMGIIIEVRIRFVSQIKEQTQFLGDSF